MTAVVLRAFGGVSPRTPPRYLQNNQAQKALNCYGWVPSLKPLSGLSAEISALSKVGTINSIYRFGQDVLTDENYWFHWLTDVDVVRGFINGDTSERTYFTGDGIPKATDNSLALSGGTNYPVASYMMGLPLPDVAPICSAQGLPDPSLVSETRVYTYTWVNSWSEESAPFADDPMPASTTVTVTPGQAVDITLPVPPAGPHNITHKRIYRSVQGSFNASYLFVAEIPAAQTAFTDTVTPEQLGEECPSITWFPPPANLSGLVGMAGGVMAGFVGQDVYFSSTYRPFAWPLEYVQTVGYPIVGLGAMDTTLAVLTKGRPYFIQGSDPASSVMVEADINQACASKRSIVSMLGSIFYASPDGLVMLNSGGSSIVTESIFMREQWQELKPSSIHAYQHDNRYIGFYDTGAYQGGFVFDPSQGQFIFHDVYVTAGYSDLRKDKLFLAKNNKVLEWAGGSPLQYTWRSKQLTFPHDIGFSCLRVEAESYPITCNIYRDEQLAYSLAVNSGNVHRIPPGKGRTWEIELIGSGEVYSAGIAESPSELANA